ncbi:MAG TPA: hypothetical protein VI911_00820 [Patescibacteria group bacterium]|nr:hypothetical protein [Patescibacteria group bacterium]
MNIDALATEVEIILKALFLTYRLDFTTNKSSFYIAIPMFGVVINGIYSVNYKLTDDSIDTRFNGYRIVYVTTEDLLHEWKISLIWALMRSGYLRYIRSRYSNQFKTLIIEQDFARRIIKERLRIWADKPKYVWLANENKEALGMSAAYILSVDPAFYDMMPEEE